MHGSSTAFRHTGFGALAPCTAFSSCANQRSCVSPDTYPNETSTSRRPFARLLRHTVSDVPPKRQRSRPTTSMLHQSSTDARSNRDSPPRMFAGRINITHPLHGSRTQRPQTASMPYAPVWAYRPCLQRAGLSLSGRFACADPPDLRLLPGGLPFRPPPDRRLRPAASRQARCSFNLSEPCPCCAETLL